MKSFALLLVVVTSFSCSTIFNRKPATAVSQKPRHVIITVHGLSGNALTWGSFAPITENYLTQIDPNYEVQVSNFLYPTGRNENLTTFDFANALNTHIESLFQDRPLAPDDRISLVGHSQGGIVSYIWYFSRILNDNLDQKYMKQVDTIITLGTPFWGSKLATILTDKNYPNIVPLLNLMAETPVTHRELVDMSFGSDSLHTFRQLAIKMDTDPNLQNKLRKLPVRLINILGVLPQNKDDVFANRNANAVSQFGRKIISQIYKLFDSKKDSGVSRVESDIAVMIPSGRWNFIYSKPYEVSNGENRIPSTEFHHFKNLVERNRSKFLFTESVHLPFDNDNTLSMAYINKSCEVPETCEHPTYRYILEQLANCENAMCDKTQKDNIITKMKLLTYTDKDNKVVSHQANFKNIGKSLQTFSVQIEMKLNPGMISKFPVKYFVKNNTDSTGADIWQLNEPTLLGKVLNLQINGAQLSRASTENELIHFAPKSEMRAIDIVSKESDSVTGQDIIRMNVIGYLEEKDHSTTEKMVTVPLSINLPGQPKVDIQAVVQPGYSTYLALDYTQLP